MTTTDLMPDDVANRITPYVTGKTLGDISLHVDDARIHLRNSYWRVPVRPSREPNPLFPYYEMLAGIEEAVHIPMGGWGQICLFKAKS